MVSAEHADHNTYWVGVLHAMPHATWWPDFGLHVDPTPELAYSDPVKFAQSASWVPAWTFGVTLVSFLGLTLAVMGLSCCKPCRAVRPTRSTWYTLVAVFGVLTVGMFLASATLVSESLTRNAHDTLHVAELVKDDYDGAVDSVKTLSDLTAMAYSSAAALQALNATAGNDTRLQTVVDELGMATSTASDITGQIDHAIDMQSYIDSGDHYISISRWSAIGLACFQGLVVVSALAIALARALCSVASPVPAAAAAAEAERTRCYRCGVGAVVSVVAVAFLGSLFMSAGLWTMATVTSDICPTPYAYLNILLNGGNATATSDGNDNIATFYANCNDATGGPVNQNIDEVYAQVSSTLTDAEAIRDQVSSDPSALALAGSLVNNITAAETIINGTRTLVDCRRVHEVSEALLDQLCAHFVPVAFWYAITTFSTALLLPVFLIISIVPLQGEEPTNKDEGDTLLAPRTSSSNSCGECYDCCCRLATVAVSRF